MIMLSMAELAGKRRYKNKTLVYIISAEYQPRHGNYYQ
jgi:hypothetical protein